MSQTGALVRRWIQEVWNEGNVQAIDEILADDSVVHNLQGDGCEQCGTAPFKEFHRQFVSEFSDIMINIEDLVVEGDRAAARCQVMCTQKSSGKKASFGGVMMVRVAGNKFVEGWNHFDFHLLRQQVA